VMFLFPLALFAMRDSAGETLFLEVFKASVITRKLTVKIIDGVP
jgi:hypothetical protein